MRISLSQNAFSEVPMMGFEPIPRFSRERILSPLRLPFRHIGAGALDSKLVVHRAKMNFHVQSIAMGPPRLCKSDGSRPELGDGKLPGGRLQRGNGISQFH